MEPPRVTVSIGTVKSSCYSVCSVNDHRGISQSSSASVVLNQVVVEECCMMNIPPPGEEEGDKSPLIMSENFKNS